jgi:hypothetical protein
VLEQSYNNILLGQAAKRCTSFQIDGTTLFKKRPGVQCCYPMLLCWLSTLSCTTHIVAGWRGWQQMKMIVSANGRRAMKKIWAWVVELSVPISA